MQIKDTGYRPVKNSRILVRTAATANDPQQA